MASIFTPLLLSTPLTVLAATNFWDEFFNIEPKLHDLSQLIDNKQLELSDQDKFTETCRCLDRLFMKADQNTVYDDLFNLSSCRSPVNEERLQSAIQWMILKVRSCRPWRPLNSVFEYKLEECGRLKFLSSILHRIVKREGHTVECASMWFELLLFGHDKTGQIPHYFKEFFSHWSDEQIEKNGVRVMTNELIGKTQSKINAEDGVMLMFLLCKDDQDLMKTISDKVEGSHSTFIFPNVFLPRWIEYHKNDHPFNNGWYKPDRVLMRYVLYMLENGELANAVIPDTDKDIHRYMLRSIARIAINGEKSLTLDLSPTCDLISQLIKKAGSYGSDRSFLLPLGKTYYSLAAQLIMSSMTDQSLHDILAVIKDAFGIKRDSDWRVNFKNRFGEEMNLDGLDNHHELVALALSYDSEWTNEFNRDDEPQPYKRNAQRYFLSCLIRHSSLLVNMIIYCATLPGSNQAMGFPRDLQFKMLKGMRDYQDLWRFGEQDSDYRCIICLERMSINEGFLSLPKCRHVFHRNCVETWFKTSKKCPMCRAVHTPTQNAGVCDGACLKPPHNTDSDCKLCRKPICDKHITRLPCNPDHVFHSNCIAQRLKDSSRCPVCHNEFHENDLRVIIRGMIDRDYGLTTTLSKLTNEFRNFVAFLGERESSGCIHDLLLSIKALFLGHYH